MAQVLSVSTRQGSRCATTGPHATTATAVRTAGAVPQPTWASQ
ncbi:Uncharacterised protein [Mycobacterium tuberculosis]|nr:Uncharacterised protein [Mycobacterium tuberculosis]